MNANYRRVLAEFGPETRFELRPAPPAPFRALQENQFEQLKTKLVEQHLRNLWKPELSVYIRRAANEAAALAWVTPYPLLVFPALFDEKAYGALQAASAQSQVHRRSSEFVAV